MYIQISGKQYACTGYDRATNSVKFSGVEDLSPPITGMVILCDDDGFELATQNCGDYARQVYTDGVLTLTNEPEPVPVPTPEPQPQPPSTADMAEAMIDLDTRVSMLEMGVK